MTALQAYRLALAEGLTAKQAGAKFNMNHQTIAKCKTRYNLPTLRSEWDAGIEEQLQKLNDTQLMSYFKTFFLHKNRMVVREFRICKLVMQKRGLDENTQGSV